MPTPGIPDYQNLDATGEARDAAERLEARAQAPASEALFNALVLPLLPARPTAVLEVGCGTGALARRIYAARPSSKVYATDKSAGMISFARQRAERASNGPLTHAVWDVVRPQDF